MVACSPHRLARAQTCSLAHPDDPSMRVEYFMERPKSPGPWPVIIFLHGHQEWPSGGARDFVKWGVLDEYADRGMLAVAVSQPGYGGSTGPRDFCGPLTQHAVAAVIAKLRGEGYIKDSKIVLEGVSRGAIVAGLVATHDRSISGLVLISGVYDFPAFLRRANSPLQRSIAESMKTETGGSEDSLKARSLLYVGEKINAETLILNGARDDRTDPDQAVRLADLIRAHGGRAQAIIYPAFAHQIPIEVRSKDVDPFIQRVLVTATRR
jgi:dipeptidyl aminopeptidase/acylaminoacyl peptidase